MNIASLSHLLKKVDLDVVVDYFTLSHVMKSKMELASNKIKRLLGILSSYTFNLFSKR